MSEDVSISIESVRLPDYRKEYGDLADLGKSISDEGLHRPITLWRDGTLISGSRRLRVHFLLGGVPGGSKYRRIPAVFVDTVEDVAKALLADRHDDTLALPMKAAEVCRLWEVIRKLDEPAARVRIEAARRRGVELRRAAQSGDRKPGRNGYHTDYVLDMIAPAFDMSYTNAYRLWSLYCLANSSQSSERREAARQALPDIDSGARSLWACYKALFAGRKNMVKKVTPIPEIEPAPAAKQLATWARVLPQMEGLVAGLIELGPPNPDLTWENIAPTHGRLAAVRRDLEKIIRKLKEEQA